MAVSLAGVARVTRRGQNALKRVAKGLRLRSENVSPETPNDLFQAHVSIYAFAADFCRGARVLDLGCGTGYGAALLRERGATEVVGVDLDPANVRYARSHFGRAGLRYEIADAERLPGALGRFQAIVTSNMLEHLADVDAALAGIGRLLDAGGACVVAVPPILDQAGLEENLRNPFHRSNLFVAEWHARLVAMFARVQTYRQMAPPDRDLDFTDPFPSRVRPEDFRFPAVTPESLGAAPTLGVLFVCTGR